MYILNQLLFYIILNCLSTLVDESFIFLFFSCNHRPSLHRPSRKHISALLPFYTSPLLSSDLLSFATTCKSYSAKTSSSPHPPEMASSLPLTSHAFYVKYQKIDKIRAYSFSPIFSLVPRKLATMTLDHHPQTYIAYESVTICGLNVSKQIWIWYGETISISKL